MSLGVLTQTFYFIPKTSLASVIIAAMFTMMEFRKVIKIYKTKRLDIIPFLGTFLVSLWSGLEIGIIVGVGLNLLITLYSSSRPDITVEQFKVS